MLADGWVDFRNGAVFGAAIVTACWLVSFAWRNRRG